MAHNIGKGARNIERFKFALYLVGMLLNVYCSCAVAKFFYPYLVLQCLSSLLACSRSLPSLRNRSHRCVTCCFLNDNMLFTYILASFCFRPVGRLRQTCRSPPRCYFHSYFHPCVTVCSLPQRNYIKFVHQVEEPEGAAPPMTVDTQKRLADIVAYAEQKSKKPE
jgi:hypothetical protein